MRRFLKIIINFKLGKIWLMIDTEDLVVYSVCEEGMNRFYGYNQYFVRYFGGVCIVVLENQRIKLGQ